MTRRDRVLVLLAGVLLVSALGSAQVRHVPGFFASTFTVFQDGVVGVHNVASTTLSRWIFGGAATSTYPGFCIDGTTIEACLGDGTAGGSLANTGARITAGSATGLTIADEGSLRGQVYKAIIDETMFTCAATTCDVTIGTIPARTYVSRGFTEITETFACTATCTTSTLSMTFGVSAGGTQLLLSQDVDAATGFWGNGNAQLGTMLERSSAVQAGSLATAAVNINVRLTSGTGNIGNGATTNLSQGSITLWLFTQRLP